MPLHPPTEVGGFTGYVVIYFVIIHHTMEGQLDYNDTHFRSEGPRGYDENCSQLSLIFFSDDNMDILQKKLILGVYRETGVKIPYQQPERLLIAMRHIYTIYSKELPCMYKEQIRELDNRVIEWILPDVVTAVEQHIAYLRDISGDVPLLEPPINVSRRGRNSGTPSDRQLPDSVKCCPYDTNPDYPERRPATLS